MSKFYTGIGSRDTPHALLNHMQKLATRLQEQGYVLRSGGAGGADSAFEAGAGDSKQIFLPYDGFNGRRVDNERFLLYKEKASAIAATVHPVWDQLDERSKAFHSRNVHQVLGWDLNDPSDFLICWTPGGKVKGGTATAIRLAKLYNVPVFNLATTDFKGIIS